MDIYYYHFHISKFIHLFLFPYFECPQFHNVLYGDAKGFARKVFSFCTSGVPRVMNPHTKVVQQWNKILVIFCLVAVFLDPLFFFSLYVQKVWLFCFYLITKSRKLQLLIFSCYYLQIFSTFFLFIVQEYKCIIINWTMTTTLVLLRSLNDLVYFLNMLLQVIS